EYDVVINYKNTMLFPPWRPQAGEKFSVEKSSYTFICPADYQFRYKAYNYSAEPVGATEKNKKFASWSVSNLPAMVSEPFAPRWNEITTAVLFGPTNFQVGNYD